MANNVKPGVVSFSLSLDDDWDELFASLQLGDQDRRRQVPIVIANGSEVRQSALLVENIHRKDPNGERWHFKGFLIPAGGRWIHVQGFLRKANRRGNISAQRHVYCPQCDGIEEARWSSQTEKFCKLCGTALVLGELPIIWQ